jgi:hypothetical protein
VTIPRTTKITAVNVTGGHLEPACSGQAAQ